MAFFGAALAASGCMQYRTYPLLVLEPPAKVGPLELSGVAVLDDGRVVAVAEGEADRLWAPDPDRPLSRAALLDLLPLRDGRDACGAEGATDVRCAVRNFRGEVRLRAEPVRWIEREGRVRSPFDVEDLTAFGPDRVLGITKYSTVGRRTGFRRELIARSRRQTERLFVLERRDGVWYEQDLPEVTRLRDSLSDWGRANCNDDMLAEGLAWDGTRGEVYVGLSRCSGPVLRVLRYPLDVARAGGAAALSVLADGAGATPVGPAEGLTGLSAHAGELWAVTAWDSYGYDTEAAFGGRLWRVAEGTLELVAQRDVFHDRPSALALLPGRGGTAGGEPDALVLFDNDAEAGSPWRPNATLLTAPTRAPADGAWVELRGVESWPDALPAGLNGFDLRWFARDHRLSQVAFSLAETADGELGAWTRALGGRWQMEVGGSLGMWARALLPKSTLGRNRQAVALTDYRGVPGLKFTRYRVRLSVIPRDRERENPSVAELLESTAAAYTVQVPLPAAVAPDAGVILQGFAIDTAARAQEGICVAGIDLSARLGSTESLEVRSVLIGGLCNDFDNRGPTLRHGRTTAPDGGVSVILDLAVVEGASARPSSLAMWDRALPAPPPKPGEDRLDAAVRGIDDTRARASAHCGRATGGTLRPLPRGEGSPPPEWLDLAGEVEGDPSGVAGSLRGFAFAWDPVGFDPGLTRPHLTEAEALARNNYVYRALARTFVDPGGAFFEAGMSHGIHKSGPMRDNARPSASYARVDLTTFPTLPAAAPAADLVAPSPDDDPNLLPEDAFTRWAVPFPLTEVPTCSSGW